MARGDSPCRERARTVPETTSPGMPRVRLCACRPSSSPELGIPYATPQGAVSPVRGLWRVFLMARASTTQEPGPKYVPVTAGWIAPGVRIFPPRSMCRTAYPPVPDPYRRGQWQVSNGPPGFRSAAGPAGLDLRLSVWPEMIGRYAPR